MKRMWTPGPAAAPGNPSPTVGEPDRGFRPDIEGLRAVAVALVVLGHAGVPRLAGGYVGVDMFFVLSGFLITGQLLKEHASRGRTSLAGFYARRARRILPAASLVLIVTVAASQQWLGPLRSAAVAEDGRMAAIFAANLHFASEGTQYLNVSAPPSPLQHYWSLAVEEQFYLVWPLLFLVAASVFPRIPITRKLAGVLLAVIVISFAWSLVQTGSDPVWAFFSPLTRAWELAAGALLAVLAGWLRRLPGPAAVVLGWAGIALAVGAAVTFDDTTAFPGSAAALPVVGTAMVVASGSLFRRGGVESVLRLAPFQLMGRLSYSLYLWHWPLLIIPAQRSGEPLNPAETAGLVVAAFVLAAATHYLFENPVRYARVLTRRPAPALALGACLVLVGFGFSGLRTEGQPGRLGPAWEGGAPMSFAGAHAAAPMPARPAPAALSEADILAAVRAAQDLRQVQPELIDSLAQAAWDFAWLAPGAENCVIEETADVPAEGCIFGDPDAHVTIALFGDSHAAMWLSAIDRLGEENGWRVVLLSKAGCPVPALDFARAFLGGPRKLLRPFPECSTWHERAVDRLNALQPQALILASCTGCEYMVELDGRELSRQRWADGLRETFSRLELPARNTLVLSDIPRLPGVLDCIAVHNENAQKCAKARSQALGVTYNDTERAVAAEVGAGYLDVSPWFCAELCPPIISGIVAYTNEYHLTASYGRLIAPLLEPAIRAALDDRQ